MEIKGVTSRTQVHRLARRLLEPVQDMLGGTKSRMVSHLRVCQANRNLGPRPTGLLSSANGRAALVGITMQFCLILHLTISLATRLVVKELDLSFRQQTG